jgi:hypothetical protein
VDLGWLTLILLFKALIGAHPDQLLARWLLLGPLRHAHWVTIFVPWHPVIRRWHVLCFLIRRERATSRHPLRCCWLLYTVGIHPLLYELVELVDRDVLEAPILSLTHKPDKDLLVSILLPLVVGLVEGIAGLLIECSESVGRVYERILEA